MKDAMKEWFDQQEFDREQLPEGHEERFLARLETACEEQKQENRIPNRKSNGRVITMPSILKWSAAAVIAILIGSASFYIGQSQSYELKSVSPAMAKAQSNYVEVIDQQLAALNQLQSPATERIIADAKAKLLKLETDYSKIKADFKTNGDNPAVIDAMIQNFKTRILLLEDARAQINAQQDQLKKQQHEIL
ncbi:hypothetical protein [Nonlabens marinus]|uniref:Anti-sigma factor n=1 Tax=Nonlabens marinus S1-08 TaxID=1454201 RepID=W8VSP6_9FLAO|nr:hypothetical protein [Nonlabens marinus]BAO56390.1 hypothetical protein NMS_2381 [Nonlabens marinus S1-08]